MAESTWEDRDLRVLEAVRAAELAKLGGAGDGATLDEAVAMLAGMPTDVVRASLHDLYEADPPYVAGSTLGMMSGGFGLSNIRLTERGRRAVGQWPTEQSYDALLQVLTRQIEAETEPDKRRALEKIRDGALGAGREVGVSLITAFLKAQAGI